SIIYNKKMVDKESLINHFKLANYSSMPSFSIAIFLYFLIPVPAGISLPSITFSFSPIKWSSLPFIAASVKTLVVSWNDAADKNESVARDAFVIPRRTLLATAGLSPFEITSSLHLL